MTPRTGHTPGASLARRGAEPEHEHMDEISTDAEWLRMGLALDATHVAELTARGEFEQIDAFLERTRYAERLEQYREAVRR